LTTSTVDLVEFDHFPFYCKWCGVCCRLLLSFSLLHLV